MVDLYGIPNCNTVKKALVYLQSKNIEVIFHNFKKEGVSEEKLKEWISYFSLDKVVNKAGTTYRKLNDEQKQKLTSQDAAISVLQENTSLIKRPIIEWQEKKLLGFNETEYNKLF